MLVQHAALDRTAGFFSQILLLRDAYQSEPLFFCDRYGRGQVAFDDAAIQYHSKQRAGMVRSALKVSRETFGRIVLLYWLSYYYFL